MSSIKELVASFYEVEPLNTDQFLKVKETLTRIGLPSRKVEGEKPILWQSCHVLHKKGHYYICHFKQLFQLDGRTRVTDFTDEDQDRTEFVVALLEEWGLVKSIYNITKPQVNLVVIPFAKKCDWDLRAKYSIGEKKLHNQQ